MKPLDASKITLRVATSEDSGAIYDFALIASKDETVPDFLRNSGDEINQKVNNGQGTSVILAFTDHELIGILDTDVKGEKVHLQSLYVRLDFRRSGLASRLVKYAEELYPNKSLSARAVTEGGMRFWNSNKFKVKSWEMEKKK